MDSEFKDDFLKSLETGFFDKEKTSDLLYRPELLVNDKRKPPKKVLTTLLKEFEHCESFYISVAFVTTGGVAAIINTLQSLKNRGTKGKILVSQYLNFTQPEALRRLLQFDNIKLRIATKDDSHSKGYIFKRADHFDLIIGSSNLTQAALSTNKEWNLKVSATEHSEIAQRIINEFEKDFALGTLVDESFIKKYETVYNRQRLLDRTHKNQIQEGNQKKIKPNSMQIEALENLKNLRKSGERKALVISATGTGKTYLAAFDAKSTAPNKLLFVVHRQNIAKKAMATFQMVFDSKKPFGLFSGKEKEKNADFLFSTIQTVSKEDNLKSFRKDQFDYIIIDESHRSGAKSYRKLIEYFTPKFLLGMTATPERTDGADIFELFGHNIAYEIRLNRAMEEEMLCPFHYYGVSDLFIEEESKDDLKLFNRLTSDERVRKIVAKSKFYGCDNGIVRGLVFCSRVREANELSEKFNLLGFKTIAIDGSTLELDREAAIKSLEEENLSDKLDYIFTVDVFNEGIDIPSVNQIIMLRPTDSAIIFVQQMGRGLRLLDGKSYLTIIDFIGNHSNNYLIPMALYGDSSYSKDKLRKLIFEGSKEIPGCSTINFDQIAKERIFESIDSTNMKTQRELKNDYFYLKKRLGRVPMMMDFIQADLRDPFLYVAKSKSFYNFIQKVDRESVSPLEEYSRLMLEYFSREINNSKRVEESLILKILIEEEYLSIERLTTLLNNHYHYTVSNETIISAVRNLNFKFVTERKNKKQVAINLIHRTDFFTITNEKISRTDKFKELLLDSTFKHFLKDNVEYSIANFNAIFESKMWLKGFILYSKYSRKDVFRILNWRQNPIAQNVSGYQVNLELRNCALFVNYQKDNDISASTKYEDEFLDKSVFAWMSKNKRKIASPDVQSILGKKGEMRLPLFIKKDNGEGKEFYFMGDVIAREDSEIETTMKNDSGKTVSVVKILFDMQTPVSEAMFAYLTEESSANSDGKVNPKTEIFTIPFYNFHAAASQFSEIQSDPQYKEIEVPEKYSTNDHFACKVFGESMNRRIPNGSICIFKKYGGGSRNGKIVLVQNFDYQDPDFNAGYTVKTYSSQKTVSEEGWAHNSIILRPNSTDSSYSDIVIDEQLAQNMKVIGEFVDILK